MEDVEESDVDGPVGANASERYAWHFDMLHDDARLKAFCGAFDRLPKTVLQHLAMDVGCGTGILGLSLLRQRPELSKVVAFESDPVLAEVTKANAVKNGLAPKLQVHALRSTAMSFEPGDRAKLLVAEILDAGLLGEDCLGTLRHASDSLLCKDYWAIPASADVFACAVESSMLTTFQTAEAAWWTQKAPGYRADQGDANPHDVALEKLLAAGKARLLTDEFFALSFDFESLPDGHRARKLEVAITRSGRLDAIVFWWYCYMLRGDKVPTMTNAPSSFSKAEAREIDHWRQAVCILPYPRPAVQAGQVVRLVVFHTDEDIWFRVQDELPVGPAELPRASSNLAQLSSSRLWMLSDEEKYRQLQQAMHRAVKSLNKGSPLHTNMQVVDLSDGPFMSFLAFKSLCRYGWNPKSRRMRKMLRMARTPLISLETNEEDLQVAKELFAMHPSCSSLTPGFTRPGAFRHVPKVKHLLGSPCLTPESVSMICGEPFARECEGLPCDSQMWHHWAQVDALRFALKPTAVLLPRSFRLKAVLLSCHDLWRRRQEIQSAWGVDVSAVNRLHPERRNGTPGLPGSPGRPRFPCGLWQVEHAILSDPVTLCQVDLAEDFPDSVRRFPGVMLGSGRPGVHGIATWTEVWFSKVTGWIPTVRIGEAARFQPSPMLQGVLLAKKLAQDTGVWLESFFSAADGSLHVQARWSSGAPF
ncbi:PRMT16 [Symbiodinium natans]|uniref:PRMT16 protein n=1 Tax=Symbiodinium natans TaxID=878477 RepID=A0A812VAS4_9DINO|nr:PRMT16 [Symbiodinium natans]